MKAETKPSKRIAVRATWHARRAGGLFLGLRLSFPTSVLFNNGEVRSVIHFCVGLLVFTIDIEFRGKIKENLYQDSQMRPSLEEETKSEG
jgi:hypothetical protein